MTEPPHNPASTPLVIPGTQPLLLKLREMLKREIRDMGSTLAIFIPCWLVFTTLAYELRSIPSESMTPTLQVGDRVAVSKFAYGYSPWSLPFGIGAALPASKPGAKRLFGSMPKRGDVVVFRHPNSNKVMIKRVIGLPGDSVQMRKGRLYLNQQIVPRKSQRRFTFIPYNGGFARKAAEFQEILPDGLSHPIHEFGNNHPYDQTPIFHVPENHLFMMGDSRDNSEDSRAPDGHPGLAAALPGSWNIQYSPNNLKDDGIGFVPLNHLIGRANTVLFTFHRCSKNKQRECPAKRLWRPLGKKSE